MNIKKIFFTALSFYKELPANRLSYEPPTQEEFFESTVFHSLISAFLRPSQISEGKNAPNHSNSFLFRLAYTSPDFPATIERLKQETRTRFFSKLNPFFSALEEIVNKFKADHVHPAKKPKIGDGLLFTKHMLQPNSRTKSLQEARHEVYNKL